MCKCQWCCVVRRSVCAVRWEIGHLHPVHAVGGGRVGGKEGRSLETGAEMNDKQ